MTKCSSPLLENNFTLLPHSRQRRNHTYTKWQRYKLANICLRESSSSESSLSLGSQEVEQPVSLLDPYQHHTQIDLIIANILDYELVLLDMVPEAGLTWRGNPNELIASYAVVSHQSC
jgi:hypothetical protein